MEEEGEDYFDRETQVTVGQVAGAWQIVTNYNRSIEPTSEPYRSPAPARP